MSSTGQVQVKYNFSMQVGPADKAAMALNKLQPQVLRWTQAAAAVTSMHMHIMHS